MDEIEKMEVEEDGYIMVFCFTCILMLCKIFWNT